MTGHDVVPSASAESAWRPRVLDYLDDHVQEMVSALSAIVRVPSVSGSDEENSVQSSLAGLLADLGADIDHWPIPLPETLSAPGFPGMEVDRREAWGLVGRVPGTGEGQTLMLNAHVDVVPSGDPGAWPAGQPFSGSVRDGSVWGRGACDMKAGLVASVWTMRALTDLRVPLRGDLLLACVQGEEDGGLGTFATLARGWRADACVIPEPTSLDLVPASAGSLTFRLRIQGLATHASRRTSGVSALEKFWPVFQALRKLEARRNGTAHPLMARWDVPYPIEIGAVRSGDWASSVPGLLVAEGRCGVALDEAPAAARHEFEAAVQLACENDPWLRDHPVDVEWWGGQFAPGVTDPSASIALAVMAAHTGAGGGRQQVWGAPYGSDLRLMSDLGAVPTVHYGPGDAGLAHGPQEHVPVAELLVAARTLAVLTLDFCGTA
jgi:acetylornithine deacetylase